MLLTSSSVCCICNKPSDTSESGNGRLIRCVGANLIGEVYHAIDTASADDLPPILTDSTKRAPNCNSDASGLCSLISTLAQLVMY